MKLNKTYALLALIILCIEVLIAIYASGFIRHTFGDVLAVVLVYACIRSISNLKVTIAALVALGTAFCIEFLQRTALLELLGLDGNLIAKTILGNTFSINDLIAYTAGIFITISIEFIYGNI